MEQTGYRVGDTARITLEKGRMKERILGYLSDHPNQKTSIMQIAKGIGCPPSSVYPQLVKLVQSGEVSRNEVGGSYAYTVNGPVTVRNADGEVIQTEPRYSTKTGRERMATILAWIQANPGAPIVPSNDFEKFGYRSGPSLFYMLARMQAFGMIGKRKRGRKVYFYPMSLGEPVKEAQRNPQTLSPSMQRMVAYIQQHPHVGPTKLAKECNIGGSTVFQYLRRLIEMGFVERQGTGNYVAPKTPTQELELETPQPEVEQEPVETPVEGSPATFYDVKQHLEQLVKDYLWLRGTERDFGGPTMRMTVMQDFVKWSSKEEEDAKAT